MEKILPHRSQKETILPTLGDVALLSSRTVRQYISAIISYPGYRLYYPVVFYYGSPSKLIYIPVILVVEFE